MTGRPDAGEPRTAPEGRCAGLRRGDHLLLGLPHEPAAYWNAGRLLARERDTLFVQDLDMDGAGDPRVYHVERVRAFGTAAFCADQRIKAQGATLDSRRAAAELDEHVRQAWQAADALVEAVNAETLALCESARPGAGRPGAAPARGASA